MSGRYLHVARRGSVVVERLLVYVLLGAGRSIRTRIQPSTITAPIVASFAKNVRWQGVLIYTVGPRSVAAAVEDITAPLHDGVLPVGEAAGLPLTRFPLKETAAAHDAVENGTTGMILIRVANETA